jgi:hypothetical protein
MTSPLRQRLRLSGGGLAETSAEELAKLTGRAAAPTSPMETGVIGGNEDQSKMAGTPAQKISALRSSIQGAQDLSTRMRREQVRRTATAEEEKALSGEERLQQLGDLESRVEQLAESALLAGAGQTQQVQLAAEGEQAAVDILNRIRDNPNDMSAISDLYRLQGIQRATDILAADGQLTAQAKQKIFDSFGVTIDPATGEARLGGRGFEQIGGALAESVQDKITSGELNFEEMGFSGVDEVANLLGTDAQSLQGMGIQDMLNQLNSQIEQEYSAVADLQRRASDPSLGAAERAEARRTLREMGAVGIRSAESDIDQLADEIAEANTVEFMGEELATEDLLDNDYVSGLVLNYFQRPDFAKKMEESEPELVKFIKKHENILLDSVADIDQRLGNFAALQKENLDLAKTEVGDIDEDVMKEWIPGYGEISAKRHETNAAIDFLKSDAYTPNQKQDLKSSIDMLKNAAGKRAIRDLGTLDLSTIQSLGLTDRQSEAYKKTEAYYENAKKIEALNPLDYQQTAKLLGGESTRDVEANVSELKKKLRSGLFGDAPAEYQDMLKLLPPGEDPSQWTEEDWKNTAAKLKDSYLPGGLKLSLRDLVSQPPSNLADNFSKVKNFSTQRNEVYNLVEDAFENDNRIDITELRKINNDTDLAGLNSLYKSDIVKEKADKAFDREMVNSATRKYVPRIDELAKIAGYDDFNDVGVSFFVRSNWASDINYAHVNKLFGHLEKSLLDDKRTAEARGETLTVKAIDNFLMTQRQNKAKLDDKYERRKKEEELNDLGEVRRQLENLAKKTGLKDALTMASKFAGFLRNPEQTTREEIARWDAQARNQLSQMERTVSGEASRAEARLRGQLIEPVIDALPGGRLLRSVGEASSRAQKGKLSDYSESGKATGKIVSGASKGVQRAISRTFKKRW